jgi:malate permease and related proteins
MPLGSPDSRPASLGAQGSRGTFAAALRKADPATPGRRVFIRILEIVTPVFLLIAVGAAYGRRRMPDMDAANRMNLDVFIPALVFSALSQEGFELSVYFGLGLAAVGVFLLSGAISWGIARIFNIQPKTLVPPMMFRNAGNMGLPLMTLAFGERALPAALVLFLLGNFLHFGLGAYILDRRAPVVQILLQPALLAAVAGLIFSSSGMVLSRALALPIEMLGAIAVPMMLFSLGVRMSAADFSQWRIGVLGAVLSPLLGLSAALLMLMLFELPALQTGVLLLFAALPPAVMNFLFAERYAQEPAKVASIVVVGNAFSVVILPLVLAYALPRYG